MYRAGPAFILGSSSLSTCSEKTYQKPSVAAIELMLINHFIVPNWALALLEDVLANGYLLSFHDRYIISKH